MTERRRLRATSTALLMTTATAWNLALPAPPAHPPPLQPPLAAARGDADRPSPTDGAAHARRVPKSY